LLRPGLLPPLPFEPLPSAMVFLPMELSDWRQCWGQVGGCQW
jgi:hypothetical protein